MTRSAAGRPAGITSPLHQRRLLGDTILVVLATAPVTLPTFSPGIRWSYFLFMPIATKTKAPTGLLLLAGGYLLLKDRAHGGALIGSAPNLPFILEKKLSCIPHDVAVSGTNAAPRGERCAS